MRIEDSMDLLEENLVNVGDWIKAHPTAQQTAIHLAEEYGGNIGIGYHEDIGWYVLHQQQGEGSTGLVWKEKDDTNREKEV